MNTVPAGWYPNPQAPNEWRYWDGASWTTHTAPMPSTETTHGTYDSEAPDEAFAEDGSFEAAVEPAPPQEPVWTPRTFLILGISLMLILGGIIGGVFVVKKPYNTQVTHASQTLEGFLEATTVGDPSWTNYTSIGMAEEFPASTPFRGDAEVAEALDLNIDYDIIDVKLNTADVSEAYYAQSHVWLTFDFTHEGKEITHETVQIIWLTRPFFESDQVGTPADLTQPDAVGEWKVTAMSAVPRAEQKRSWPLPFETSFAVASLPDIEDDPCAFPVNILEDISASAREDNRVNPECFYEGEGAIPGADFIDDLAFTNAIPFVEKFEDATLPPDLMGVRGAEIISAMDLELREMPLLQFRFEESAEAAFVMTLSVVQESPYRYSYRVIRIDKVES